MPLRITDLQPGDRVVLNCPKSRVSVKREAVFEGIFESLDQTISKERTGGRAAYLAGSATAEFLGSRPWARFLMQSRSGVDLIGAFAIQDDGTLKDEEGRSIFIERRVFVGVG
jgi:hypothetical protein